MGLSIREWWKARFGNRTNEAPSSDHTSPSTGQHQIILYTRVGCHLCENVHADLEKLRPDFDFTLESHDIDQDPELREKFDTCVPVLVVDGKIRFRGAVNLVLLRRMLR